MAQTTCSETRAMSSIALSRASVDATGISDITEGSAGSSVQLAVAAVKRMTATVLRGAIQGVRTSLTHLKGLALVEARPEDGVLGILLATPGQNAWFQEIGRAEVTQVMGGNFMRVYEEILG